MIPARIPILYLILGVLILVSVVPLYIYGTRVVDISRERLKTNENLLQNTVTGSLARIPVDWLRKGPYAYKDPTEVVDACEGAGLARIVARLRPVGVIKG